jgi:Uma2 family endonuclease
MRITLGNKEAMSTRAISFLTPEKYLEIERAAEFRSEYLNGEVFAMSGGTLNHGRIALNTASHLREQLLGKPCEAAAADFRLYCAEHNLFTYPDIVVFCASPKFLDQRRDTITDATAVVEVLSPSTKNYDRGEKFRYYRSLPSFAEYLLLAQDEVRAEHHIRQLDGSWLFREFTSPAAEIELLTIGCRLGLESLYERVEFEATGQ